MRRVKIKRKEKASDRGKEEKDSRKRVVGQYMEWGREEGCEMA